MVAPNSLSDSNSEALVVRSLGFSFPLQSKPVISDFSLSLPRGSRCLLLGANG